MRNLRQPLDRNRKIRNRFVHTISSPLRLSSQAAGNLSWDWVHQKNISLVVIWNRHKQLWLHTLWNNKWRPTKLFHLEAKCNRSAATSFFGQLSSSKGKLQLHELGRLPPTASPSIPLGSNWWRLATFARNRSILHAVGLSLLCEIYMRTSEGDLQSWRCRLQLSRRFFWHGFIGSSTLGRTGQIFGASLGATKPKVIEGAKIFSLFNFKREILAPPISSGIWTPKLALRQDLRCGGVLSGKGTPNQSSHPGWGSLQTVRILDVSDAYLTGNVVDVCCDINIDFGWCAVVSNCFSGFLVMCG
jgi:hypothetical protein